MDTHDNFTCASKKRRCFEFIYVHIIYIHASFKNNPPVKSETSHFDTNTGSEIAQKFWTLQV